MRLDELKGKWQGGLIVSCQAPADSPLAQPNIIAALALTAEHNGAVGVRIEGKENIRAVKDQVKVPVLGIEKLRSDESEVYITPTFSSACRVHDGGADCIALDATRRPRPNNETLRDIVARIHSELNSVVIADVATEEEGIVAIEEAGADMISTTLAGYTAETRNDGNPDLTLVKRLAKRLDVPVICEGRLRTTEHVEQAFACGAFAVVIGTAITGVDWLVNHFVAATPKKQRG